MAQEKILETILKLRPSLEAQMVEKRDHGDSYETIAKWLARKTHINVGREVVRRWFNKDDDGDDE